MGSKASKSLNRNTNYDAKKEFNFVDLHCDSEIKQAEINKLRKEYQKNIQLFLLNQVLFSVMFFHNYEKELSELSISESNKSVKELNLTDELYLSSLEPDEVFTLVNKHVTFNPRHGPNKNKESPLVTNRIFVIHENIQIIAREENDYANIDKPSLTAQVIEKTRAGYVKLKYIEDMKFKTNMSSNSSIVSTSDDTSSFGDDDDLRSETYGRITQARTIKPMPIAKDKLNKTLYPISEVKLRDLDDDDNLFIYEYYVDSKNMKELFHRNWSKVSELLELDDNDVANAGFNCDSIFCYSEKKNTMWEIIPAVRLPKGAYEKFVQKKSISTNTVMNRFKFPTNKMLQDIENMERLAVPRGFISKYRKDPNPDYHLEWELAHPKVEKYLQNSITHTHMKTLLMLLLLHKTFIEPRTSTQGITIRHLMIHLFWELQKNVVINETRMGARLMEIMQSFCKCLGTGKLFDYFEEDRNHFANIPSPRLRAAQEIFSDAKNSPLVYFLSALMNLKYINNDIPKLDFKELYECLATNKLLSVNKQKEEIKGPERKTKLDWETKMRRTMFQQQMAVKIQENLKLEEEKRKISVDSIDYRFDMDKVNSVEEIWLRKSRGILTLFIDHYIEIAKSCHNLGNQKQSESYLNQAEYLTYLFHVSCYDDAKKYQDTILRVREEWKGSPGLRTVNIEENLPTLNGPKLPERTSSIYVPTVRIINRNHVDMRNVLEHHQSNESRILRKNLISQSSEYSDNDSDVQSITKRQDSTESKADIRKTKVVSFGEDVQVTKTDTKKDSSKNSNFVTKKLKDARGKPEESIETVPRKIENSNSTITPQPEPNAIGKLDIAEDDTNDESDNNFDYMLGLDEVVSDDDDIDDKVVDTKNPIEHKINLGHVIEDSYS